MHHEGLRCASALLIVTACTVTNDENPFATGTATVATIGSSATASTTSEEDTDTDASGESEGSSSGGGSTEDDGTSTTDEPGSTSMASLGDSSSGAVDPTDGQPADGMYSTCTMADDCGNLPIFCITNADATDGFCSETGCANAAADCDPAPGGTATPTCIGPLDIDGSDEMACALSCSGGLVCPTGMACMNFTDLGMICM